MDIAFPFRIDARGRTASSDMEAHVRELIEQVLFTSPGERVNRPTFGSGVLSLVFSPVDEALGAALQHLIQSSLQQWLQDMVQVEGVAVEQQDSTITVTVAYVLLRDGERRVARLSREV
jgi:uncharacterized protein